MNINESVIILWIPTYFGSFEIGLKSLPKMFISSESRLGDAAGQSGGECNLPVSPWKNQRANANKANMGMGEHLLLPYLGGIRWNKHPQIPATACIFFGSPKWPKGCDEGEPYRCHIPTSIILFVFFGCHHLGMGQYRLDKICWWTSTGPRLPKNSASKPR